MTTARSARDGSRFRRAWSSRAPIPRRRALGRFGQFTLADRKPMRNISVMPVSRYASGDRRHPSQPANASRSSSWATTRARSISCSKVKDPVSKDRNVSNQAAVLLPPPLEPGGRQVVEQVVVAVLPEAGGRTGRLVHFAGDELVDRRSKGSTCSNFNGQAHRRGKAAMPA